MRCLVNLWALPWPISICRIKMNSWCVHSPIQWVPSNSRCRMRLSLTPLIKSIKPRMTGSVRSKRKRNSTQWSFNSRCLTTITGQEDPGGVAACSHNSLPRQQSNPNRINNSLHRAILMSMLSRCIINHNFSSHLNLGTNSKGTTPRVAFTNHLSSNRSFYRLT